MISIFLVSFANFSSIGIIAGAVKGLDEERGNMVSRFGLKLVYGSTLVSILSALIGGLRCKPAPPPTGPAHAGPVSFPASSHLVEENQLDRLSQQFIEALFESLEIRRGQVLVQRGAADEGFPHVKLPGSSVSSNKV